MRHLLVAASLLVTALSYGNTMAADFYIGHDADGNPVIIDNLGQIPGKSRNHLSVHQLPNNPTPQDDSPGAELPRASSAERNVPTPLDTTSQAKHRRKTDGSSAGLGAPTTAPSAGAPAPARKPEDIIINTPLESNVHVPAPLPAVGNGAAPYRR